MCRALIGVALALAAAAVTAGPVTALPLAGISENNPAVFDDPALGRLRPPSARLVVPWNAIHREPQRLALWLAGARRSGARPLIVFAPATDCAGRCAPPSTAELQGALRAVRRRFPWVTDFTPWNEPNVAADTAGRPEVAARWHDALARTCARCVIVAGDVLDNGGMEAWLARYRAALGRPATVWGLHNYYDARTGTDMRTRAFLRAVDGEVWLTETGGIVRSGSVVFGEQAAARALQHAWDIAVAYRDRITRIYIHSWFGEPPWRRFDAGLTSHDGRRRPAFWAFADLVTETRTVPPPGNSPRRVERTRSRRVRITSVRWLTPRHLHVRLGCEGPQACTGRLVLLRHRHGRTARLARVRLTVELAGRAGTVLRIGRRSRLDGRLTLHFVPAGR